MPRFARWWLIGFLTWNLGMVSAASSQESTLTVDPRDDPLVLRGVVDDETTTLSGFVRLTARGAGNAELQLLASDLILDGDPATVVARHRVSIPDGIRLSDAQPRDVRISVDHLTTPGHYRGELELRLAGHDATLILAIELELGAKPDVIAVDRSRSIQVVRCGTPLTCGLASRLLPRGVVQDRWQVHLENRTALPVEVEEATMVIRGDHTGYTVGREVKVETPHLLPATRIEPIELTIDRRNLSPDRYRGDLRFHLADGEAPVIVHLDLEVRDGPLAALLVLLFGILVGRLVRRMETPESRMQVKLLPRYYQLQTAAAAIVDSAAFGYVSREMARFKDTLAEGRGSEEALTRELARIEARIELFKSLEELGRRLQDAGLDALRAEIEPLIEEGRRALLEERIADAETLRSKVETRLRQAREDGTMGPAADLLAGVVGALRASGSKMTESEGSPPSPGGRRWNWLARWLAATSGAGRIGVEVRFWLVRPMLWLALLVSLILLGLQTLYVKAGTTFGAAGFYDYLGLFLWGLSADVVQRSLQNLQSHPRG